MCKNCVVFISVPFVSKIDEQKAQKELRQKTQQIPNGNSVCIKFVNANENLKSRKAFEGKSVRAIVFIDLNGSKKENLEETIRRHHPEIENILGSFDELKEKQAIVFA